MEKNLCITSKNEMSEGLFGMVILFIFEILPLLEINNIEINNLKWDISTSNYGNIFPFILEYNSEYINPENINNKISLFDLRNKFKTFILGDDFTKLSKLFFKYFKIPKELELISDSYNLQNVLGIHFRGTDKTRDTGMNNPISINDFYIIIDSFLKNNTDFINIFLATDENAILDYLKNKYTHINFITSRNFNHNLFWKNNENVIDKWQRSND